MDNRYFLLSILVVAILNLFFYIMGTPVETLYGVTPILLLGCCLGTVFAYYKVINR